MSFIADAKIAKIARAYSEDAVDFAQNSFGITLDFSDASVEQIEAILDRLHRELPTAQPSDKQVFNFAKLFGSYIGEVFRRNHAATWGMVTLEGQEFPGMQATRTAAEFWPWGKVQKRLLEGADENVWDYFRVLVDADGHDCPPAVDGSFEKLPWWKKLFGAK